MKIFNKRVMKLKWRLLLIILPVAVIPISIIIWFIYGRIFTYLESERRILNDTMVYQVTKNINSSYDTSVAKIPAIMSKPEIEGNIYRKDFRNMLEERDIDNLVNGQDTNRLGLRELLNTLDISGLVYIVNKDLNSQLRGIDYKYWFGGYSNEEPNFGRFMESDPLFKEMSNHISLSSEGAKNAKPIFGKLSNSTFSRSNDYVALAYPVVNDTRSSPIPGSKDYSVFLMMFLTNMGSSGFIADSVKDVSSINQGTVYVLDYKNEILYCNYLREYGGRELDPEFDTDEELGIYADYINQDETVLQHPMIQNALRDDYQREWSIYNSTIFRVKHENHDYQTFVINSDNLHGMTSGIKVVFLYPRQVIGMAINRIIFQIILIVLIFVVVIFFLAIAVSNTLVIPISRLDYATNKVSQGYLDVEINTESKDEIGSLYKNFKRMIKTINEVLSNIQKSSNDLIGFQVTLDKVINNFEHSINSQAGMVNESNIEFSILNDSIKEVIDNVKSSLTITRKSQNQVQEANLRVNEMVDEIKAIAETSNKISSITELINGISEQTRLLSLNAAIEASRSGEAGKGFNVVASEIRKLASQSNQAANEIGGLIKMNDKKIKEGVSKTKEINDSLHDINTSFKILTDAVTRISTSADEEYRGSQKIMSVIQAISLESDSNIKLIKDLSKTRDQLSMEVKKMRNLILAFKVETTEKEIIYDVGIDQSAIDKKNEKKKMMREEKEKRKQEKIASALMKKNRENQVLTVSDLKKKIMPKAKTSKKKISSEKKAGLVKLPEKVLKSKFENKIINKIKNESELEIIRSSFTYDDFTENYILKNNLADIDKKRVQEILTDIKFK